MKLKILSNGKYLQTISHQGNEFIEAPESRDYTINLYNNSPKRKLAVVSVDGINVLDGKEADHNGVGYVIDPWQAINIEGWKRKGNKAAKFEFKSIEECYSNQIGKGTDNVGVIGVAVFDEKVNNLPQEIHIHHHHDHKRIPINPWPLPRPNITFEVTRGHGTSCSTATKDVGTGYGREVSYFTKEVEFEKKSPTPSFVITLRYATRDRLISWGVPVGIFCEFPSLEANPFPASSDIHVPSPPEWKG